MRTPLTLSDSHPLCTTCLRIIQLLAKDWLDRAGQRPMAGGEISKWKNLKRLLMVQLSETHQDECKSTKTGAKKKFSLWFAALVCVRVRACYLEMSGSLHLAYLDTACLWHSNYDGLAALRSACVSCASECPRGEGVGVRECERVRVQL